VIWILIVSGVVTAGAGLAVASVPRGMLDLAFGVDAPAKRLPMTAIARGDGLFTTRYVAYLAGLFPAAFGA
jgi:hypothetical protein